MIGWAFGAADAGAARGGEEEEKGGEKRERKVFGLISYLILAYIKLLISFILKWARLPDSLPIAQGPRLTHSVKFSCTREV